MGPQKSQWACILPGYYSSLWANSKATCTASLYLPVAATPTLLSQVPPQLAAKPGLTPALTDSSGTPVPEATDNILLANIDFEYLRFIFNRTPKSRPS